VPGFTVQERETYLCRIALATGSETEEDVIRVGSHVYILGEVPPRHSELCVFTLQDEREGIGSVKREEARVRAGTQAVTGVRRWRVGFSASCYALLACAQGSAVRALPPVARHALIEAMSHSSPHMAGNRMPGKRGAFAVRCAVRLARLQERSQATLVPAAHEHLYLSV
jgi:hypothetical protein